MSAAEEQDHVCELLYVGRSRESELSQRAVVLVRL